MPRLHKVIRGLIPVVLLAVVVVVGGAQEIPGLESPSARAQQSLRAYWHVFAAYTIVIVVVMAWLGSIAKRLRDVEARLGSE